MLFKTFYLNNNVLEVFYKSMYKNYLSTCVFQNYNILYLSRIFFKIYSFCEIFHCSKIASFLASKVSLVKLPYQDVTVTEIEI